MTPLLAGAPQAIVREFSQQRARRGRYFSSAAANYIEDVFQTYLYTGNNSTQTITNDVDLAGKGGLVWIKSRPYATNHILTDTERGFNKQLRTNETGGHETIATLVAAFNSNGFSLGAGNSNTNSSGYDYASWTFRKQAKFFDVVTYTGNGSNRTIAHSLGSVPGTIIVKRTDTAADWQVYHRSLANTEYLVLNSTAAKATGTTRWNSTTPTSTEFSLGTDSTVNANAGTYVAYLFAHDAGGFGDSGNESVVSCGYVVGSSQVQVEIGWEPQWLLVKNASVSQGWWLVDNMRGLPVQAASDTSYNASLLQANLSDAETTGFSIAPSATGFKSNALTAGQTYIYIAIRRGPMRTPTDATKVFGASSGTYSILGTSAFAPDMMMFKGVNSNSGNTALAGQIADRLRGFNEGWAASYAGAIAASSNSPYLVPTSTSAESTTNSRIGSAPNQFSSGSKSIRGIVTGWPEAAFDYAAKGSAYIFRRAPSFFDVVAYTGTSNSLPQTVTHNLSVKPEMMIVKRRDTTSSYGWHVWHSAYESYGGYTSQYALLLNTTAAPIGDGGWWNQTSPTSTSFTIGDRANMLNGTFIAYLFASCPGVSKVGSYTGTGTTLSVDCGFTAGARFVLIKRTDSTGDWYVWDTTRGIVSGNDPYLLLNSTAVEVTNTDYIDPLNSGFEISSTAPAAINANGGTFMFLAIA